MLNRFIILGLVILAGAFGSCTHPASPPSPPDSVVILGPKTCYTGIPTVFTARIGFPSNVVVEYQWTCKDTSVILYDTSIGIFFKDTGKQVLQLTVLRTGDSAKLCFASDTITVLDTIKIDTTTHDTTQSPSDFTWTQYLNVNGENDMTGCWVFGPNDIYAINGDLHHFDGTSWSQATLNGHAPGALSGASMFGFNDNDFWIVDGSIMYHWNGNTVIETRLENTVVWHYPQDGTIHSAWGTSSSDMYFVGDSGSILHFDGTNWTKMNSGTTNAIGEISGTSDNDIWADGFNPQTGSTVVLHYNGSNWSVINPQTIANVSASGDWIGGVWTTLNNGNKIVYLCGTQIWHSTNEGGSWSSDSGQVLNKSGVQYAFYMSGNSGQDVMVATDGGLIDHWNGTSWHRYDTLYSPGDNSYSTHAFSMKSNTACAVGWKDGQSWIAVGQR